MKIHGLETNTDSANWAIITPSYIGDLERCELLCRSVDAFVVGRWHHYIIVDKPDLKSFRRWAGPRRTVMSTSEVLERGQYIFWERPFGTNRKRTWWSWRSGSVGGWQIQQIVKIGMASLIAQEAMLFCDSDVIFVRQLLLDKLLRDGAHRFYRAAEYDTTAKSSHNEMVRSSEKYLGLAARTWRHDYIDNLVTWHRPTAILMQNYIADVGDQSWQNILSQSGLISEYTLYGLYVDEIQGNNSNLFLDSNSLCKTRWQEKFSSAEEISEFFSKLSPQHVAVGVQSFIDCNIELLRRQFDLALAL